MNRREWIMLLGSAAAAWPMAANAQQGDRVRRIGVSMGVAESSAVGKVWFATFVQELAKLGWTQGGNAHIETRWTAGDADKVRAYAANLVALKPDVILAAGTLAISAIQQETRTIPVVGVLVIDMVASGFAESLARPGGNITCWLGGESSRFKSSQPARISPFRVNC